MLLVGLRFSRLIFSLPFLFSARAVVRSSTCLPFDVCFLSRGSTPRSWSAAPAPPGTLASYAGGRPPGGRVLHCLASCCSRRPRNRPEGPSVRALPRGVVARRLLFGWFGRCPCSSDRTPGCRHSRSLLAVSSPSSNYTLPFVLGLTFRWEFFPPVLPLPSSVIGRFLRVSPLLRYSTRRAWLFFCRSFFMTGCLAFSRFLGSSVQPVARCRFSCSLSLSTPYKVDHFGTLCLGGPRPSFFL